MTHVRTETAPAYDVPKTRIVPIDELTGYHRRAAELLQDDLRGNGRLSWTSDYGTITIELVHQPDAAALEDAAS